MFGAKTVITSNYVTKQLERDWLELCGVKIFNLNLKFLLQRSISKPCIEAHLCKEKKNKQT